MFYNLSKINENELKEIGIEKIAIEEKKQEIIKRNGRNFTILEISKKDGFEVEKNSMTISIKKNSEEFDEAYLLDQDEKNYFFEGEDKDFIYKVSKNEITLKNNAHDASYFSNDENDYNLFSEMSEEEIDITL